MPLQSTKEQMHTIRTLGIGRHKQLAMGIYIGRIYKKMQYVTRATYAAAGPQPAAMCRALAPGFAAAGCSYRRCCRPARK